MKADAQLTLSFFSQSGPTNKVDSGLSSVVQRSPEVTSQPKESGMEFPKHIVWGGHIFCCFADTNSCFSDRFAMEFSRCLCRGLAAEGFCHGLALALVPSFLFLSVPWQCSGISEGK